CALNQRCELGRRYEAHADEISRRIAGRITRVAHPIGLALAAIRREDFHRVTLFREHVIWMGQLTPPEANRPSGCGRHRRIRQHDRDALGLCRIDDVGIFQAHKIFPFELKSCFSESGLRRIARSVISLPTRKTSTIWLGKSFWCSLE